MNPELAPQLQLSRDEFLRYSRQLLLEEVGESGQLTLKSARVLIIGMGGLGCPAALYLAAAGIGQLTLCDGDSVDKTNLQRQLLYREADIGRRKVSSAAKVLRELNPNIAIATRDHYFNDSVAVAEFDLVLDCTDNLASRQAINAACAAASTPLISASAQGWEGQVVAFDFAHHPSPCLRCLFPLAADQTLQNCATSGVLGPVLGAIGSLQALLTLRLLLGQFDQHGLLQRFDGKRAQWLNLKTQPDPHCPVCQSDSPIRSTT